MNAGPGTETAVTRRADASRVGDAIEVASCDSFPASDPPGWIFLRLRG